MVAKEEQDLDTPEKMHQVNVEEVKMNVDNKEMNEPDEEKSLPTVDNSLTTPNRLKRKFQGKGPTPRKKAKTDSASILHTPLSMLNQIVKGLQFKFIDVTGPSHCPIYKISVEVQGQSFIGSGIGKQQAKQNAAEQILSTMFPVVLEKYKTAKQNQLEQLTNGAEATVKQPVSSVSSTEENTSADAPPAANASSPFPVLSVDKQMKLRQKALDALAGKINPLAALNEILPGAVFNVVSENNTGCLSKFVFHLVAEGQTYKGSGPSKKAAKTAAARAYFNYKYVGELPEACGVVMTDSQSPNASLPCNKFPLLPPSVADSIADLILVKYDELMSNLKEYAKRKVLAGICMTQSEDMSDPMVISIATGTKTVGGEYISVSGAALNDSHAEVAARRGLLRYLYSQLLVATSTKGEIERDCIFEKCINNGFKLKGGIRFHLYISSSPCGDARIFSPHEVLSDEMMDRHPNRHSRGQLRTKIESGEGTIPVKPDQIQTWDGVMQGNRLLTMSCSDKILKWNVLGLQGTLLSHFIAPIYVYSLVISNLYNEPHIYRALRGRIESELNELPVPFKLNRPFVNKTTSPEARVPGKAPNHSVNWTLVDNTLEVVNMMTGKIMSGSPSRLAKISLASEFMKLLQAQTSSFSGITLQDFETYADLKLKAKTYEDAKNVFLATFPKAGLGTWVRKPFEQNQFEFKTDVSNV